MKKQSNKLPFPGNRASSLPSFAGDASFMIAPSLLSADFTCLEKDIIKVKRSSCTWLHLDIMDGHFVPNITFGPPLVKSIRKRFPDLYLDAHLMIDNPFNFLEPFIKAGADLVNFHAEVCGDVKKAVKAIHEAGAHAGLTIKPGTPWECLKPALDSVDLILIMSVEPGFGGQKLIPATLNKVRALNLLRKEKGFRYTIQIDGGINIETASLALAAGADILVAGSAVFDGGKVAANIRALHRSLGHVS